MNTVIPGATLRTPIEFEELDVPISQPLSVPQTIPTAYGNIPLERLVTAFAATQRHAERRREWLQTDEGKAYNRQRARDYYDNNRARVLQKRSENYEARKTEINNRSKAYYLEHREEIIEKNKQRKAAVRRLREIGVLPPPGVVPQE